jgi:hypothetical protein
MKKLILSFLLMLACSSSVLAQGSVGACPFSASSLKASYKEMITVSTTAKTFTLATWWPTDGRPQAVCATVVVNTNSVSWWASGDVPTSSDGIIAGTSTSFSIGSNNMASFQMIRAGASDASVAVQYFTLVQ